MESETAAPSGVQSLERAFGLLALLAQHHDFGLPIRQVVHLTGLSRPTVHRMLSYLMRTHYVEQDAKTHAYRLGSAAMLLGMRTMSRPPLVTQFINIMRRLAHRTGEGVFMIVRIGDYSYNIHHEQISTRSAALQSLVGATRLLGLGVGSLSLLSMMSDAEINQHYERHQGQYSVHNLSLGRLITGVERTRRLGYSIAAGEGVAGAGHAFDVAPGQAAISVFASRTRMPLARRHEIGDLIVQEVRSQIGG
ncbi:helix-turn-helix domain-containing protein [Achromobacter pestifer]|uniref:Helix-turn-helix domain-containing protein n=1 Tax=Achromobacter pestifer TaxID=1353889 RepID=A0A7D4E1V0_9BURK|nr:helix-turn-helix domain-containing protein [Achromobacter pestifer]QKH36894.1 helix-turn-helix domain-containing protein [Achromobacter pestifer]